VNPLDRVVAAWDAGIDRARRGSDHFDHVWRARVRYNEQFGPRLAAAIAYYGFFAAFALSVAAYSVLGYVLSANRAAIRAVDAYLQRNMPFLKPEDIQNARQTLVVASTIGLVLAGVGWVDGMRSAQRAMWGLEQQPGNLIIRRLVDLTMLVGIGLLLSLSLGLTNGIHDLVRSLLLWTSPEPAVARGILSVVGQVLSFLVNLLMAASLLIGVPRLRVSPRRMLGPTILVGVGLTLLTTVGRLYVNQVSHNPAYKIVGAAAGLLVFLNLFSQLLLFGAALAATSKYGPVTDLAAGPPPDNVAKI
jgi:membrane protein